MKIITVVVAFIIAIIISIFIKRSTEYFNGFSAFETYNDAEFRGMNMMGVNSLDTHIATNCESKCQDLCLRNNDCVGYSWYEPGNRCYIYSSGGFVFGRKGFKSGIRI